MSLFADSLSGPVNWWLLAAGGLSFLTLLVHFFVGGREVARPLLDVAQLDNVAKYTNYYCWHLVTLTLLAMSASFAVAGVKPAMVGAAFVMFALAVGFALWNVALWIATRQSPLEMPQWILFGAIALVAGVGLLGKEGVVLVELRAFAPQALR